MSFGLVREKQFYTSLVAISVPIALQNLISFGLSMMDTIMLGIFGETQISASSIANQPYFIFTLFLFGLSSGACVLTAQYWGKKDMAAIGKILAISLKASIIFSAVFGIIVIAIPELVMSVYTPDKAVIEYGAKYLRIVGASYIFSAISTTYLYLQRSVESVKIPLLINFCSFLVNVFLNWILIFGKFGFPRLEIVGSAFATFAARGVELILAMIYGFCIDKKLTLNLKAFFQNDKLLLRDFIHYSSPVVINETLWGAGMSAQSIVIGHISSEAVAANSIAGVVQRLSMVLIMGFSNYTAVAVGKQIGAGDNKRAKEYADTMLKLSILVGLCACGMILILRKPFLSLYTVNETTFTYAYQIMTVYSVTTILNCMNNINIVGILRGGGDTKFAMYIDITFLWVLSLPAGAIAGLVLHLPLPAVIVCLMLDEAAKVIFGIVRFSSGKWLNNVTR